MANKILIIGFDGGTWKLLDPLIKEGYMPNLKKLVEEGVSGVLESTKPPITPAAWTSFQTGVNPGKHGIFNFSNFDRETKKFSFVNSNYIKVETILEYLDKNGKKVISINLPMTYPPKKINKGIVIGGLLTPSIESNFVYPPELKDKILKKFPNYLISLGEIFSRYDASEKGFKTFLDKLVEQVHEKAEFALYLMKEYQWDLFIIQFQSLDTLQHGLWKYLDYNDPLFDREKLRMTASQYFKPLDDAVGKIRNTALNLSGNDKLLSVILSDHGFRPVDKSVNLWKWLIDKGYLCQDKSFGAYLLQPLVKLNIFRTRGKFFFRKLVRKKGMLFNNYRRRGMDIQRSAAIAFGGGWGEIFILSQNIAMIREEIINSLKSFKDPLTKEPVIEKIYKKEDIYHGSNKRYLPDLIIKPRPGYRFITSVNNKLFADIGSKNDPYKGDHDSDGMVLFNGALISSGNGRIHADICDVTPTILYFMGLSVPLGMDGKLLKEIFNQQYFERNPPKYIDSPIEKYTGNAKNGFKGEEEKELEEKLKGLGYL